MLKQAWSAGEEPLDAEMLTNAGFAQGTNNWTLQLTEGAKAIMQTMNDAPDHKSALRVQVQQPAKAKWHVQLYQQKLRVQRGKTYTLTFWAKADVPRAITVNGMQAHAPWQNFSAANITLKKEWQPFTFTPNEDDDNARITFTNMGESSATYWFAAVSLKLGAGTSKIRAKTSLQSKFS